MDSVYVHTTETVVMHDTTVLWKIPDDSAEAVLPDSDTSHLSTGLAESDAWVKDGRLYHTIRNRSSETIPILLSIPTRVTESEHGLVRTRTVEVEKKLSKWEIVSLAVGKACVVALMVLALLGLIVLIFKVKKLIR